MDMQVLNRSTKDVYNYRFRFLYQVHLEKTWEWGLTHSAKTTQVREGDLLSGVIMSVFPQLLPLLFFTLKRGLVSLNLYIASDYLHLFHLACMAPEG